MDRMAMDTENRQASESLGAVSAVKQTPATGPSHSSPPHPPQGGAGGQPRFPTGFPRMLPPMVAQAVHLQGQLREHARLPRPAQLRTQAAQTSLLLRHAASCSPFWKQRLESVGALADPAAFGRIPILTRAEIRAAGESMRARLPGMPDREFATTRTSGSTGQPVAVEQAILVHKPLYEAVKLLDHEWHGRDARGTRCAIRDARDAEGASWGDIFALLGPTGRSGVRSMIDHPPETLLGWLRQSRPHYLVTTPVMAQRLARLALAEGRAGPPIRQILTFGEVVTPEIREICRTAFGARICDRYSCEELGWIALQCPKHDHLHVMSATVRVEIVDDQGRPCGVGEPGRVLLTALQGYAMPLIRYELGDVAEWGPDCDCGITLPVLRNIQGRRRNFLRLPDGSERIARLTGDHWHELPMVEEYRVVQYADTSIEVFLRATRPLSEAERETARALLRRVLGHPFEIFVTETERIDWGTRWKREDFVRLDTPRPAAPG